MNFIFPPGGRRGTKVEAAISGDEVTKAATGLWFNHPAITAEKTGDGKFRVQIGADVPVGLYDVRATGPKGVSDARTFAVSDLPEMVEMEPNNAPSEAVRLPALPLVVNGQVNPEEDVDQFLFWAAAGQRIVIEVLAQRIDATPSQEFLFDATIEVTAPDGTTLAVGRGFNRGDPFLDLTVPRDGEYRLKIWDAIYRGSEQCFYRLRIGVLPYLDYVFPAGGQRGTKVPVTYAGRLLPGGKPSDLTLRGRELELLAGEIDLTGAAAPATGPPPGASYGRAAEALVERLLVHVPGPGGGSNPRPFMVGDLPEVLEQEPNDRPEDAERVRWPVLVNGQAGKPGDLDYFEFEAQMGQTVLFQVFAQRLGSPMDAALIVYNDQGEAQAQNDDLDPGVPTDSFFSPTTADAALTWAAPADGRYRVLVRDLYGSQRGGPEFVYRLEIRAPDADFRLVVVPDHRQGRAPDRQQVPQGGRMEWMAYLQRRGGFAGEVEVEARGLPPGVTMEPLVFGPNVSQGQIVLHAATGTPPGSFAPVTFVARARVPVFRFLPWNWARTVEREAAFVAVTGSTGGPPAPQRVGRSAIVSVTDPAMVTAVATPAAVTVSAGDKLAVKVTVQRRASWNETVELAPPTFGFPNNVQMANVDVPADQSETTVELQIPKEMPPGRYVVALNVSGQAPQPDGSKARETYPSSPIVFTVLAGDR
jgi:hypothetical protein